MKTMLNGFEKQLSSDSDRIIIQHLKVIDYDDILCFRFNPLSFSISIYSAILFYAIINALPTSLPVS